MGEGGVAEGGGEGGDDCDEEERREDAGCWEGRGDSGVFGGGEVEVQEPGDGGEGGLDGVEDYRVGPFGAGDAVGGCCYALLEEGPGEANGS